MLSMVPMGRRSTRVSSRSSPQHAGPTLPSPGARAVASTRDLAYSRETVSELTRAAAGASDASRVSIRSRRGPGFPVRVLWYVLGGWWLTGFALALGYVAGMSIVGLPLAFWIFDRTGTLLTLRPRSETLLVERAGGRTLVRSYGARQLPLPLRALWFVLVGWWAALVWIILAYAVSLTVIGIPLGIVMLNRLPAVFTLQRN
jgi:uncharacterized membrane protein YccF (DUF307 family)